MTRSKFKIKTKNMHENKKTKQERTGKIERKEQDKRTKTRDNKMNRDYCLY